MSKNTLQAAQDKFYYGYAHTMFEGWYSSTGDYSGREIVNTSFAAGARWALRETSILSPWVNKFIEMLILLGVFDREGVANQASPGTEANPCGQCGSYLHDLSEHVYLSITAPNDDTCEV